MKAIKNDGCVSSFFTYTGPYDGDSWDEIDFEVLGRIPPRSSSTTSAMASAATRR